MRTNIETDDGLEPVIIMARPVDPVDRKGGMRLNSAMKSEVVVNAVQHGFGKRYDALLKTEHALHKACWLKCFGPAKLKHAQALGSPWIMDSGKDRYGNKTPDGVAIQFSLSGYYFNLRGAMPVPMHGFINGAKDLRVKDEGLLERCREWQDAVTALNRERTKVEATLAAMLNHITTYPSLEKNWPAGKKFYEHLPKRYPFRHQVPAVQIEELNAALGV